MNLVGNVFLIMTSNLVCGSLWVLGRAPDMSLGMSLCRGTGLAWTAAEGAGTESQGGPQL